MCRMMLFLATLGMAAAARHSHVSTKVQSTAVALRSSSSRALVTGYETYYGSNLCPCIGFDNLEGEITVYPTKDSTAQYPAELGSSCKAWDLHYYPKSCNTGQDDDFTRNQTYESWCYKKWCYVDPCNCQIPQGPKISAYLPDAKYHGMPLYYSYETCGASDDFTSKHHAVACVNQKDEGSCTKLEKCAWDAAGKRCAGKEVLGMCAKADAVAHGTPACQCIGIDGYEGQVEVDIGKGRKMMYPADTGSRCEAWETVGKHPDCTGPNAPSWCTQKWCYVDPCKCKLETPPKTSAFLPDVKFQGRPIYYSYATCGAEDTYTAKLHKTACVNQKTATTCTANAKCAWRNGECLGKDLVEVCYGPVHEKSFARAAQPLALSLLALLAVFRA